MDIIFSAKWIKSDLDSGIALETGHIFPVRPVQKGRDGVTDTGLDFAKNFTCKGGVKKAELQVTALGIYAAFLNGSRVGDFIFAPGWTSYEKRLQYQTYDITAQLRENNSLSITLGKGWRFLGTDPETVTDGLSNRGAALLAALKILYEDGSEELIVTDKSWSVTESKIRYSNIYNGDIYDAGFVPSAPVPADEIPHGFSTLIPQQGEKIAETEILPAKELIITPKGETVIDFGQNLTGYVKFNICGKKGDKAKVYHAEVLDKDGNFYTENLRAARQEIHFICDGNPHTYKPLLSFQGFRYIRLEDWPDEVKLSDFEAVVVHSDMKRTGYFECSDKNLNQLFKNIVWGQRGNFLDVPTDCPQRDERLGWTGDAQVFCRTASYNYDTEKFFTKWLADLAADQGEDGCVKHVIPDVLNGNGGSAAWGDAVTVCPWQMYLTYGNKEILERQFESMKKWISFLQENSTSYIRNKGDHFGDWLNLDEEVGGKATDKVYIATAFSAYSTYLVVKVGKVLGVDVKEYETLYDNIVAAFRKKYIENGKVTENTQTACVLALHFNLCEDKAAVAAQLNGLIKKYGHLTTGFVGASYLPHALSDNGYAETAYDLLLRKEYPSWLYPISMGATTTWERWNGIRPDGTFNDRGMNSFNHYAYGAIADWLYGVMAGINTDENAPAFKHTIFKPLTDPRIDYVKASIDTRHGLVKSEWRREGEKTVYTFTVPQGCTATAIIDGNAREIGPGTTTL